MQILLTTKDTREGAALPLRTICYRHLSAAPTQTALSRTKSTEREEDHISHRHAEENEMPVRIEGLNLDKVYENFVKQIAEDKLQFVEAGESLNPIHA